MKGKMSGVKVADRGRLHYYLLFAFIFVFTNSLWTQTITISGIVIDGRNKKPLEGVKVYLEDMRQGVLTTPNGSFKLDVDCLSKCILILDKVDYERRLLPIDYTVEIVELGIIMLSRKNPVEKRDILLNLSETDLNDEDGVSDVVGLLQGSRDIFLNRAAFDFSQSFFRVRGYDSSEGNVHINGLPMNNLLDGRPQWNNWGGLNDIMRNATRSLNLDVSRTAFEGLMGGVDFTVQPSQMRPGTRLTASFTNRSYTHRLMATHASGRRDGILSYAYSVSARWAEEGYIQGTPYNAYSFFGSMELDLGRKSSLYGIAMSAFNRRGRSAPLTEEVFDLAGRTYNPYWGWQGGQIRNARERLISEPIVMLNYQLKQDKLRLRLGIGYQFGSKETGRLGYFQAPNPDPTYYRYLPSFYYNKRFGDYTVNAQKTAYEFQAEGQISWENLYRANGNNPSEKASYISYSEVAEGKQVITGAIANLKLSRQMNLDLGISYRNQVTENYARIEDLLGAPFHLDIDPFSNTQNDLNGPLEKEEGARFSYSYVIKAKVLKAYIQWELRQKHWDIFASGGWESRSVQRRGLFMNARYPEDSFGPGPKQHFNGYAIKTGLGYHPNARLYFNLRGTLRQRTPLPKNLFINPRDNQKSVSNGLLPGVTAVEMNTILRFPVLTGRISGFSTWFQNETEIGFYYTDSGLGSDFVQEVLTNINTWHRGLEFGLEYMPSSAVTLSLAGTFGYYQYRNNPNVKLYFDVTASDEQPISTAGNVDLGMAELEGLFLARGPQHAISLGLTYRDPDFWFVSTTMNTLNRNYIDLAVLPRTESFYLDPETKEAFTEIDYDFLEDRMRQKPLPAVYLLNMVGGKSWLINDCYLGIFASINNLFNTTFRSGGFEQSRNGHYEQFVQDHRNVSPSFGPKYWYGYGRTYFLNLSLSF